MKRVPFSIITAAKESDAEAVDFIHRHFEGYIASQCLCHCTDEYGNIRSFVDDDLRYLAEAAMLSAIFKFRFREPQHSYLAGVRREQQDASLRAGNGLYHYN